MAKPIAGDQPVRKDRPNREVLVDAEWAHKPVPLCAFLWPCWLELFGHIQKVDLHLVFPQLRNQREHKDRNWCAEVCECPADSPGCVVCLLQAFEPHRHEEGAKAKQCGEEGHIMAVFIVSIHNVLGGTDYEDETDQCCKDVFDETG